MSDSTEYIALVVNGEEISLYDLLLPAKEGGSLRFLQDAIDAAIIRQEATRHEIEVTDEELQSAADEFRVSHELFDPESTEAWLGAKRLTFSDWESLLEASVLRQKLRDVVTVDKIEHYFAMNKLSFDSADISRLVVADEQVAKELRAQIAEDGTDFHSLARTYSIDDPTRLAGGYVGKCKRADMEAVVESSVFGAQPGNVVGPFKLEDGWHVIKIEELHPAKLDDTLRETIKENLFSEWFEERLRRANIQIPLLEAVTPDNESVEDLAIVDN